MTSSDEHLQHMLHNPYLYWPGALLHNHNDGNVYTCTMKFAYLFRKCQNTY